MKNIDFIKVCVFIVGFPFVVFSYGFAMVNLYDWFIISIFTQLPSINIIQAIGIFFFIGIFKSRTTTNESIDFYPYLIGYSVAPWVYLGIAYLFKTSFM